MNRAVKSRNISTLRGHHCSCSGLPSAPKTPPLSSREIKTNAVSTLKILWQEITKKLIVNFFHICVCPNIDVTYIDITNVYVTLINSTNIYVTYIDLTYIYITSIDITNVVVTPAGISAWIWLTVNHQGNSENWKNESFYLKKLVEAV